MCREVTRDDEAVRDVSLFLLATTQRASAQQAPPIPPAPPTPPPYRMPAPPPRYLGPTPAEIDALEQSGRHRKRLGVVFMASGGALVIAGSALVLAGAADRDDSCFGDDRARDFRYHGAYHSGGFGCSNEALTVAGLTTTLVGIGALVPGIIEYGHGAREVDGARRWRARCASICWHPTVNRNGGGVNLEITR